MFLCHTCSFFVTIFIPKAFEYTFEDLASAVILPVQKRSGLSPCHFSRTIPNFTETERAAGNGIFNVDQHLCLLNQLSNMNYCPSHEKPAKICAGKEWSIFFLTSKLLRLFFLSLALCKTQEQSGLILWDLGCRAREQRYRGCCREYII